LQAAAIALVLSMLATKPALSQTPSAFDTTAMKAMMRQGLSVVQSNMVEAELSRMELSLEFLSQPHTAELLAAFTKQYYDALISGGFTKEQALQIVIHAENSALTPSR